MILRDAALYLEIEVADEADVVGRGAALRIVDAERVDGMWLSLATEGHEHALGLASLDGNDDGLARSKETLAGGAHRHVVSTVVGDDDRQLALGREQASGTASELVEAEGVGVASHGACCIGALEGVLKEGRIAEDGVEEEF